MNKHNEIRIELFRALDGLAGCGFIVLFVATMKKI